MVHSRAPLAGLARRRAAATLHTHTMVRGLALSRQTWELTMKVGWWGVGRGGMLCRHRLADLARCECAAAGFAAVWQKRAGAVQHIMGWGPRTSNKKARKPCPSCTTLRPARLQITGATMGRRMTAAALMERAPGLRMTTRMERRGSSRSCSSRSAPLHSRQPRYAGLWRWAQRGQVEGCLVGAAGALTRAQHTIANHIEHQGCSWAKQAGSRR